MSDQRSIASPSLAPEPHATAAPAGSDLAQRVIEAIRARPFVPSAEICKQLGISREQIQAVYRDARGSAATQQALATSPFFYLTKVLHKLASDETRTMEVLRGTPTHPFETLELFISADCNVNCTFCYRRDRDYGDQRILGTDEFLSIIDEFADSKGRQMDVSGGLEPLLSPAIADVFQRGIDRGLKVNLYTIGNALHNPRIQDQLMQLSQIRISFTAHDKDSYVHMMGVDHFERVAKNARMMMERKHATGSPVGIGTSYVVTPEIFRDVPKAVKFAQELGMHFFDLRSVSVWASDDYSDDERKELGDILDEIREGQRTGAHGDLKISIADTFASITDPDPAADPLPWVNHDLVNMLVHYRITVTPAGKVFPLNILGQPTREDPRFLIGNVDGEHSLAHAMETRRSIPFDPSLLLAHDKTLLIALSKLHADLEFGIPLSDNPFSS